MESSPILVNGSQDEGGRQSWRLQCRYIGAVIIMVSLLIGGGALILLYYMMEGSRHDRPRIFNTIYTGNTVGAIALDGAARICMTMPAQHAIGCLTSTGDLEVVAGGTQGYVDGTVLSQAQFNGPLGLAVDSWTGVMYVADQQNNRVRIVDLDKDQVRSVPRTFSEPHSVALNPNTRDLFVADGPLSSMSIWRVTHSGNVTLLATDLFITNSTTPAVNRIAIASDTGLLYIAKTEEGEIWQLNPETADLVRVGFGLPQITGVVADHGNVYGFNGDTFVSVDGVHWTGFYDTCPIDTSDRPMQAGAVTAIARNGSITHFADHDDDIFRVRVAVPALCRIDNYQRE